MALVELARQKPRYGYRRLHALLVRRDHPASVMRIYQLYRAEGLHGANPYMFQTVETIPDSVFKLHDTLTSRVEITDLSTNFASDIVAVIGIGGTGAYLLDFLVKTPVREIRAFDFEFFHVHNAFRSPGRLDESELGKPKADVYAARYESFRHGLKVHRKFIDSFSGADLEGVTFAFVCVDKGSVRAAIFDLLIAKGIPFIDVGMGLNRKRGPVNGMMRMTYHSVEDDPPVVTLRKATATVLSTVGFPGILEMPASA